MGRYVEARCPLRPLDACSLCQPGATGPSDCGLVYLVRGDDEFREVYNEYRRAARGSVILADRQTTRPNRDSISMSR